LIPQEILNKMAKRLINPFGDNIVNLRLLEEADLPQTLLWRNQDEIRRWFFHSDPIPFENHVAWFQKYKERDDDFVFIITDAHDKRTIGQIALYNINWQKRRAEYGRLMIGCPEAKGKGFAKKATQSLIEFAFNSLGLEEIYLEVLTENQAARKVYEQCGFEITHQDQHVVSMAIHHKLKL
jgi:diamine N-acetyltransferase